MKLPFDLLSESYRKPKVILCQTNKDKICPLNTTDLQGTFKFNSYSEISFNVASVYSDMITGEQKHTPYYDYIEGLRLVYLEGFGYFQLQDPETYGDGIQEYKSINAYSLEYALSQRYLETFIINQGDAGDTIGSIDGVVLYNPNDVEHSLLHLVLKKAYGWTIGHVDKELQSQSRSFTVDRESIYDFMMNEMCDTFKCYIEFDTINNIINVYSENAIDRKIGDGNTTTFTLENALSETSSVTINGHLVSQYKYDESVPSISFTVAPAQGDIIEITDEYNHKYDTDVFVTFDNLSNEMKVNYSADDIKTVLTVKGDDELDIRNVNFGLSSIMNLDYYCTPEWMGQQLYNEYLMYVDKQDKYMSGFYSKDFSGSAEESFDVITIKESFTAGSTQTFNVDSVRELVNINGDAISFNVDKNTVEFDVNSGIDRFQADNHTETFNEPDLQIEEIQCTDPDVESIIVQESSITKQVFSIKSVLNDLSKITVNDQELSGTEYDYSNNILTINKRLNTGDIIKIYTYQNVFSVEYALNDDSTVYLNNVKIDYTYDSKSKEVTINTRTSSEDIIKINIPQGKIVTSFKLSNFDHKVVSIKIDEVFITNYTISSDGKTLTIPNSSLLNYGSVITVESVQNHFSLSNLKDKIISVTVDGKESTDYIQDGTSLIINDSRLNIGSVIVVESINIYFDLAQYKNKKIVSVAIGGTPIPYTFNADSGILSITNYNLSSGDKIVVKLVDNNFTLIVNEGRILSVKVDDNVLNDNEYTFDNISNVVTITAYEDLFNNNQVTVEIIDSYFMLDQPKDKVVSVTLDGNILSKNEFNYENNMLTINSDALTVTSSVIVESISTKFTINSFDGKADSVYIDGKKTTKYTFDPSSNILIIDDDNLLANSIVTFNSIDNSFIITNADKNIAAVLVNNKSADYTQSSNIITINDKLYMNDTVVVESVDNHFTVLNDIGTRRVVEKYTGGSSQSETLQENNSGYSYDTTTKILTIYAPLKDGDKINIKTVDLQNALLVVNSNAKDGEIILSDVKPTLESYIPKIGDYVIKIDSYTELLKTLYDLIDQRLNAENTVPTEYNITEIKLNPDNFDHPNMFLPEANVEHLGDVYKIINQDKTVDNKGGVVYNDIAYKYYVCQMKYTKDEKDESKYVYTYAWVERDIIFGSNGINALKEKIDVYSSINDVQIAAEWDKKPKDSSEYQSYVSNIDKLQDAKKELEIKQNEVAAINEKITNVQEQITAISEDMSVEKNFSPSSLDRLSLFLREDEYTDSCFCVTDIDSDLDKINTQKELLVAGQKELKKISRPALSFSASMKNLYAMPEFEPILNQFKLGSFIRVQLRPDFVKKCRLLEIQFNFEDFSDFSCTFGDLLSMKNQGDIHADLLAQAVNAGKAVASGSSYWQKGYDVATAIDNKIKQGLIDATTTIKSNSAGQDVSWDNYGIHLRKVVDGVLDNREGWITNNKFLYSDDNFKTTQSLFGEYTLDGQTYWGVLAGCVSAGLIEGSTIIGGTICIGLQDDGTYAFMVDKDGTVTMNKGDAAQKLSYFSFDGDDGLIVGGNNGSSQDYFCRVSPDKIEFCRKAIITTVYSEPTRMYQNCDYVLYKHQENDVMYYDYYKNSEITTTGQYERSIDKDFDDPGVKFGITITYFANNTAYMKQAEIEGNLSVGTEIETPCISLGNFKLQVEQNGSLSIISVS